MTGFRVPPEPAIGSPGLRSQVPLASEVWKCKKWHYLQGFLQLSFRNSSIYKVFWQCSAEIIVFKRFCDAAAQKSQYLQGFLTEYEIWNLKSEFWNPKPKIQNLKSAIWNQKAEIRYLESEIWNLKYENWKLEPEIWNLKSEIWIMKSETWNLKSEI